MNRFEFIRVNLLGLNLSQAARLVGVNVSTWHRWEKGSQPKADQLAALEKALADRSVADPKAALYGNVPAAAA